MKANEAPEKLYVNFHFIETHPESHQPLVTKQGINKYDIEYTRTDVLIEKVEEFLSKETNLPLWEGYNGKFGCDTVLLIKNFRKYIKGE